MSFLQRSVFFLVFLFYLVQLQKITPVAKKYVEKELTFKILSLSNASQLCFCLQGMNQQIGSTNLFNIAESSLQYLDIFLEEINILVTTAEDNEQCFYKLYFSKTKTKTEIKYFQIEYEFNRITFHIKSTNINHLRRVILYAIGYIFGLRSDKHKSIMFNLNKRQEWDIFTADILALNSIFSYVSNQTKVYIYEKLLNLIIYILFYRCSTLMATK